MLGGIAGALGTISERLNALEARVDALDDNKGNKGKDKANNNDINNLETELIDLPRYLSPRRGAETGWPLGSKIHYTQPLMTKQKAKQ